MESRRLEIGDVQSMVLQEGDNPPWYQPTAEPYDRLQADMTVTEIEQCVARITREVAAWKANDELYKSKGRINPYPHPDETIMGKPKGIKQILWERGLWRPGMVRSKTEAEIKRILLQDGVPPLDHIWAAATINYWRLVLTSALKSLHCKKRWKRAVIS